MAMSVGGEVSDELALGKRLQAARKHGGFTQQQLCHQAGISYSTLTKIERGAIKAPSIFTIQSIASALNVGLDELLSGTPGMLKGLSFESEKKTSKTGVKFVYFDLNDCLVQPRSRGFAKLAADSGQPIDVVESVFWRYDGQVCRGDMTVDELNTIWAERLGIMVDWKKYYLDGIEKMPGVEALVEWAAQHYHVGVLSNSMPGFIPSMRQAGMLPAVNFDEIIDSSEVKLLKPESAIFRLAAERAGVEPHEIMLIDDSRANLMAAEDAGWRAIHFDNYQPEISIENIKTALSLTS
jgi:FMN phosphatase YigB (HAD superfamily)/DNA-binding Xre family transcriptional regulator